MRIWVNDLERQVRDGLTVADLLEQDGEPAGHVLVEVNGAFLPVQRYASRVLQDGDRVEVILPAVGG
jgi:thiamine biosynthesis protein ThiS